MPDQKRHEDQQREQRTPGRDQDRSQNMGNRDREAGQGARFDQDRPNRDRDNSQNRGNQAPGQQSSRDRNDQSSR